MNLLLPIRIVIADDHELIRNGLRNILQHTYPDKLLFVAEAKNGKELLQAVNVHQPQVVLTDIQMPVMDGFEVCRLIKSQHPAVQIIAFSMFTDTNYIMGMLRAGAKGYLCKTSSSDEMIEAICTVSSGKSYYCSTISDKLYGTIHYENEATRKKRKVSFTEKEINIMQLICRQLSTKEIARELNLAVRTIENHRYHIQEKIGARNMVGVALYAVINGLVKVSECGL